MDTSSETNVLVGKASTISKDRIQLKWECPGQLDAAVYEVNYHQLQDCATHVRNNLRVLLAACGREQNSYADALISAGANFFFAVLPADTNPIAKNVRNWYDSQRLQGRKLDIRMIWNVDVDLPWGLVFAPDPSSTVRTLEPLRHFWCIQHRLVLCKASEVYQTAEKRLPRTDYQLIPALDCTLQYYDFLSRLIKPHKKTLEASLKNNRSTVLYFCCKYDGTHLHCAQFVIDADDIRRFPLRQPAHVGLIFFNGCDVHVGENGYEWRINLYDKCDGFIDTEVPLESTEARRIFCELAEQLLGSNRTLMSVNEDVRTHNLPHSLAYTIYCWPHYSFEPHEAMPDLRKRFSRICPRL